jgi:asparagine N-glycosylation enzyme membrane subunit Stt3
VQRIGRFALIVFEIGLLTVLIVTTRCANYQDVFVAGNVYFVDGDCYARMTRAQMISAKPGLIIRHHAFENFPQGTTSHTTAPLDYLIVALSFLLNPFTSHALDLAGAFVSPLLALLGGWFLWWWSRRMKFRYRWVLLILYAISPILVHGTELGRPDHQSLLILLLAIAICAGWSSQTLQPTNVASAWRLTSAATWALAIWVSAYEPLVLFLIVMATALVLNRRAVFVRDRRAGWILFAAMIAIAFAVERHLPSFAILQSSGHLKNWASTIGELAQVSPTNPV